MTFQDVINYYLQHPPFEVTDVAAYQDMLNIIVQITLQELSENDPILEEKTFTSPPPANPGDQTVFIDLFIDIDQRFMNFVVLFPKDNPPPTLNQIYLYNFGSPAPWNYAHQDWSLVGMVADREALYVLKEWFSTYVQKIIYQGSKIKLKPNTEYYTLYERYREIDELPITLLNAFKQLLEINLMLGVYQSEIFSSEGGIRSVALSGLSVTFNVPGSESKVNSLKRQKENLLSSLALDYDGDCIGII